MVVLPWVYLDAQYFSKFFDIHLLSPNRMGSGDTAISLAHVHPYTSRNQGRVPNTLKAPTSYAEKSGLQGSTSFVFFWLKA